MAIKLAPAHSPAPRHPPLAFPANSEGRLRAILTVCAQYHSVCRRCWTTAAVSASVVAVSKVSEAIAGQIDLPDIGVNLRQ
jgi:hypothetical protein